MSPEPSASNGPRLPSLWQYTGRPGVHLLFRVRNLRRCCWNRKRGTFQLVAKPDMTPELIEGGKFEHQARKSAASRQTGRSSKRLYCISASRNLKFQISDDTAQITVPKSSEFCRTQGVSYNKMASSRHVGQKGRVSPQPLSLTNKHLTDGYSVLQRQI